MEFDVVVIGSGPGGYVCAIRAAQLGLKTACIEKYPTFGGTCLNVGCIPSKALLQSSEHYHQAEKQMATHGVEIQGLSLNLGQMMARKKKVVDSLTQGVAGLLKKNNVTTYQGVGRIEPGKKIVITKSDGSTEEITAKNIVIATGSKPVELPFLPFSEHIVSSTGALSFEQVPEHLVVVGGGVIGLEMGSVWSRLGAKVTVVEFMDRILPPMDSAVSREMKRVLSRQGMKIHTQTKVTGAAQNGEKVVLQAEDKKGNQLSFEADKVLVSVGRKPYTDGLGIEKAGITLDQRGRIETDAHFKTSVDGIFAIGDVTKGLMLAHKAEEEGVAIAEIIAGKAGHVSYDCIPNIVYTWPEVASVGQTEEELKAANIPYREGKVSNKANARARCIDETDGFVKILAHADTDRILGAHIVGPNASELIQEIVAIMEFSGSAEDLARTVHGHPTLSETIKEAALGVDKRSIHV